MFETEEEFLFENCVWGEELALILSRSESVRVSSFYLSKPQIDYSSGNIILKFFINEKIIELPLLQNPNDINNFQYFLEHIVLNNEPLVFSVFYNAKETILYINHIGKTNLRAVFIEAKGNIERENMGRIIKDSYSLREPLADIIIKKKNFILSVYKTLESVYKSFENVAYFEPITADLTKWKKESDIISDYLK